MPAPTFFIRSLVLWDQAHGGTAGDALKTLVIAQAGAISANGRQLTSVGANGKSFSYTIPPKMSALEVLEAMEEARTLCVDLGADGVTAWLSTRAPSRTIVRGRSFLPHVYPNC